MNQEKQEMVLRKNQQDRQTFSQTNNQVVHNKNHKWKRRDITTDSEEVQKSLSYFISLYLTKLEYVNKMDDFLDRFQLPKLN